MTLEEFDKIIQELKKIITRYNKTDFKYNCYSLNLSNGDNINVRLPENNVAHLLGIDVDYLRNSDKVKPNLNSFQVLNWFLEESFSIYKLCGTNGPMKFDSIFSKNIKEKLESFDYNTHISTVDLLYVIKYDSQRVYMSDDITDISDYYIVRKGKDNCYYVLGLIKQEGAFNTYVPSTSRKYADQEEFDKFMKRIANKQEFTYPYFIRISNDVTGYNNSYTLSFENKTNILADSIKYSKIYNATVAAASDFLYVINRSRSNLLNQSNMYNIINALSDCLKSGNTLDDNMINEIADNYTLGEDLKNLINVCNDVVCSNPSSNSSALANYSEINQENKKLKEELESLKEELKTYKEKNESIIQENELLKEQNQLYTEQFDIIGNAYQKVRGSI